MTISLAGLDDDGANVALTTATAADGSYSFGSLRPGSYTLTAASPSGFLDGTTRAGTPGGSANRRTIAGIALGQGVAGSGNDFASILPAALQGTVYLDANGDGTKEAGESGIGGVTVTLTGTDDLGHSVASAVITGSGGIFAFGNLRPGTYAVTEIPPSGDFDGQIAAGSAGGTVGTHQVTAIALVPGTLANGYAFGHLAPASIGGFVFDDSNDDGTKGTGESGLGGVVVTLTGTDNQGHAVSLTTTTAPDGSYSFGGLRPGTYGLAATPPTGYLAGKTSGTDCACSCPNGLASIVVASGDSFGNEQIGEVRPASLAGSVYFDRNRDDARQAGEPVQGGITITLDGVDDLGAAVSRTTATDSSGHYAFAGLRPGRYALADLRPTTYSPETAAVGSTGGVAGSDVVLGIAPGPGANGSGYNFALVGATIAGRVEVVLGDGASLGAGVGGATITLKDPAGNVLATTTTAADGSYSFADLPTGTYTLALTTPAGYSNATPAVRSAVVPLGGVAGQDFGLEAASISGFVFVDHNNDGLQETGDAGLAGVLVSLAGRDVNGHPVSATTRTLGDGSYHFLGLVAGTYAVSEPTLGGYLDGRSLPGSLGGTAGAIGADQVTNVALGAGSIGADLSFTKLIPATLSGFAYIDAHADGQKTADDPGLGNVPVRLTGVDGFGRPVSESATTAGDGSFAFPNLSPGTYSVAETTPPQYAGGPTSAGTAGGVAGPAIVTAVALDPGGTASAYDFAAEGADLSGIVFQDLTGLGAYQAGDPAIAGAVVQLTNANGAVVASAVTGPDGRYSFPGLAAGPYSVAANRPNADGTRSTTVRPLSIQAGVSLDASFPVQVPNGAISGSVYADLFDDAIPTAGDFGLPNEVVGLSGTDALGRPVAIVTTTNSLGIYAFTGLMAGSYSVSVANPAGFLVDRASPTTRAVNLSSGGTASILFGLLPPSSLSGVVYLDASQAGVYTARDFGIASIPVTLTGTDDLGRPITVQATTNADGLFRFGALRPGTYTITRGASPAFADGPSNVGSLGGVAARLQVGGIALIGGSPGQGYNFAQRVKPGCVLTLPGVRTVVARGPHPGGPSSHPAKQPSRASHPRVSHYLPRLASRL